jgi:hypothetical protein
MSNETAPSAPIDPSALSNKQAKVMKYLPMGTAALSVTGSLLILTTIFRNNPEIFDNVSCGLWSRMCGGCCGAGSPHHEQKESRGNSSLSRHTSASLRPRRKRPPIVYLRIMVAMSLYDAMYSIFSALTGTSLHPVSSGVVGAHGTVESCSMQGFFVNWGFGSFAYGAGLSLYYVMAIRYNVRDDILAKYLEPLIHGTIFAFFFGGAVVGVSLGLFNTNGAICWVSEYPDGCHGAECARAEHAKLARILMIMLPSCISVLVILISLGLVAQAVWRQRARMRQQRQRLKQYGTESTLFFGGNASMNASAAAASMRPVPTQLETVFETADSSPAPSKAGKLENAAQRPSSSLRQFGKPKGASSSLLERHADQVVYQCLFYSLTFVNSIGWTNIVYGLSLTRYDARLLTDLFWVSLCTVSRCSSPSSV